MRHTISSELPAMSVGHEIIPNLPSKEYDLNVFLQSIAIEISSEDLESLKFLCIGKGGIRKGCLSEIKSTLELFRVLRENLVITRENLLTLQAMIWHIGRKDLYKRFVEFCKTLDNTLYFFKSPDSAEEGHDLVRFHVCGYTTRNQEYLNRLREQVSKILCCPIERIFVRGVEESSSLWITLMIPTWCVESLVNIEKKNWYILHEIDVDRFLIPSLERKCISILSFPASHVVHKPEHQNVADKIRKFNLITKQQNTKGRDTHDGKREEKISERRKLSVTTLTPATPNKPVQATSDVTLELKTRDAEKKGKIKARQKHILTTLTPDASNKPSTKGETTEAQIRETPGRLREKIDSGFLDTDVLDPHSK